MVQPHVNQSPTANCWGLLGKKGFAGKWQDGGIAVEL